MMVATSTVTQNPKAWVVKVGVNNNIVYCKIDTDSSHSSAKLQMQVPSSLSSTNKTLRRAGDHKLSLLRNASVVFKFKNKWIKDTIFVVDELVNRFLGKTAIAGLVVYLFIQKVDLSVRTRLSNFLLCFKV